MKQLRILFLLALCFATLNTNAQLRYLNEVFTDVHVTKNVPYGANISVLTGVPALDTLRLDIYQPVGDTLGERPVVIYCHTGSFLPPPLNGTTTGSRDDSCLVEICKQFARRGYVVIAMSYRLGWNPVSTVQEVRTGTLINAAYRGLQDGYTCLRYLNNTYQNGNPFKIDTGRVAIGGQGTGGYISFVMACLDREGEFNIPKFIDPNTLKPYVDTSLSGDIKGLKSRPLNIPNHVGYPSAFHFVFNLGGALGDSTWMEGGEVPMVGFHVPNDPFAPYKTGAVIVPTTGDFVVEVSGTYDALERANHFGNNDILKNKLYSTDPFSTRADAINDGHEGLFPFYRPTPESAPWEWWDTAHVNHSSSILTNPDMSRAKGMAYIDSVMGYLNPRMVCALNLYGCFGVGIDEPINEVFDAYPVPASMQLEMTTHGNGLIESYELYDITGKMVMSNQQVYQSALVISRGTLPNGIYILKATVNNKLQTRKVIFN